MDTLLRKTANAVALIILWLIPGFFTAALNLVLFPAFLRETLGTLYLGQQVALWLVWAAFTPLIVMTARRFPLERDGFLAAVPVHVSLAIACIASYLAWCAWISQYTSLSMSRPPPFRVAYRNLVGTRLTLALVLYAGVLGIALAVDERKRRRERELHAARLEGDLAQAQLQGLQMQLQPHFLFNTLHAISMLVREDPEAASRMIVRLGDLLRRTLALAHTPELPLREELEILRDYLEIEETRFQDRLTVTIDAPEEILGTHVPSLILQPIVENAVRYGVAERTSPGRVMVRGRQSSSHIELEVEDDGAGFETGSHRDGGIGLAATRERLQMLYGDLAELRCGAAAGGGALVRIRIPLRTGARSTPGYA